MVICARSHMQNFANYLAAWLYNITSLKGYHQAEDLREKHYCSDLKDVNIYIGSNIQWCPTRSSWTVLKTPNINFTLW